MSRELKFRVWDKANNKFINPFKFECDDYYKTTGMVLLDFNGKIRIAEFSSGNGDNSASSVYSEVNNPDNYIVQQYTGLTDSKGNPIYEGDILKEYTNNGNNTAIGVCKQTLGGWKIFSHPDSSICYHGWKDEVIGNIFEHKHLLEK